MTNLGNEAESVKKRELKKHVAAIHCSNTLTLMQRKISNALLFHAYHELNKKEKHNIAIGELCRLIGYKGHNYSAIKSALLQLITTSIEWNLFDNSLEEDWTASTMLASVNIKGGVCSYAYSPHMKELLYSPSVYGCINIVMQSQFHSSYGLALYENCIRYRGLKYTRWLDLLLFRKIMGVPDDKYLVFRDFKRRVLDKSVQEINSCSDIIVTPELEKAGREVRRIRIKIEERKKRERIGQVEKNTSLDGKSKDNPLLEKLNRKFGLTKKQASSLIEKYDESFIKNKLEIITQSFSYKNGQVKNIAGFLMDALKNDYKNPQSSNEVIEEQRRQLEQERHERERTEKEKEKLKQAYDDYVVSTIDHFIERLEINAREGLLKEFIEHLKSGNNGFVLKKFQANGLNDVMTKALFRGFLKENHPALLKLKAFGDFQLEDCAER